MVALPRPLCRSSRATLACTQIRQVVLVDALSKTTTSTAAAATRGTTTAGGHKVLGYGPTSRLSEAHFLSRWFSSVASNGSPMQKSQVLGYGPTSRLSEAHFLPHWFSSVASNGSPMQKSQIPETNKSGAELKQSDARKSSEGATPKVVVFSPLEAVIAKPRGSPLTSESSKVRRSEIATQVTFYMIPALLLVSKNSISTSLLVGAVFHQVYMFHKEIFLDYVHHDITRKWSLIYFKLLLLVMAKDTIMYFNLF